MAMTESDEKLMDYADSRMMKYPGVLDSTDTFESEDSSDWDKACALAEHLIERGYPGPKVDQYTLAGHILKKWTDAKKANEETNKIVSGFNN